jgi:hypothetical protein
MSSSQPLCRVKNIKIQSSDHFILKIGVAGVQGPVPFQKLP